MPDTATPILTVLVINWDGAKYLKKCFQSLREQTLDDFQTVLVDNGSTDESVSLTRRDFPEVIICELGENLGYAAANNYAATMFPTKYLLLLNNDTHLDSRALAALVTAAEADPNSPILAPQQRTYDGKELLNVGMGIDVLGFPCKGKTFYSDGASLFIRRNVFHELGGFDTHYFMFFEEFDLCWRAWLHGYRIRSVPEAIVYHLAGGTAGSTLVSNNRYTTSIRRRYLGHRNQLATLIKNYSIPALCVILPLFVTLTLAELFLLALTGQRSVVVVAYVPAWRDLLRNRSHVLAMRKKAQGLRTVSDWVILRRMEWKIAAIELFFRIGMPRVN